MRPKQLHSPWTRLALTALLATASSACRAETADLAQGRFLFEDKGCYQCHGYAGQGGFAGVRIGPEPLPWEAFAAVVRQPYNLMPAYSPAILSDAELRRIYRYVESLPAPAPADEIRSLLSQRGTPNP